MTTKKPAAPCSCPRRKGWEHLPSCQEAAPKSSPLPWSLKEVDKDNISILKADGGTVAYMDRRNDGFKPFRDSLPIDAALIVRRVNQGEKMDALRAFVEKRYERMARYLDVKEMNELSALLEASK